MFYQRGFQNEGFFLQIFFFFLVFAFFLLFASLSIFIYKKKKIYRISFNSNNVNGQTFMYTQTKMFSFPNTIRKGILGNYLWSFFFIYVPCLFRKLAITAFHKFLSFAHHMNVPLFYYPAHFSGRVGRGGEWDFFRWGRCCSCSPCYIPEALSPPMRSPHRCMTSVT